MAASLPAALLALGLLAAPAAVAGSVWRDPDAPLAERLDDLLPQLTVDELIGQLDANKRPTGAIPRLGIPGFTGWNECLHGGVDTGETRYGMTSFPQPLGLAAAFDRQLLADIAGIIGTEMRAVSNLYRQADGSARALNCFGPNINIIRDPRWGRASETYGEDPHLTGELAAAFVASLQGNHSRYLQVGATCKHFAAYSLEVADAFTRMSFDARVSERDLEASYTPAFRACVGAGARSVMCSYNALNGVPACASADLLEGRLRGSWRFPGFVVSDCGAVATVHWPHRYANTSTRGDALALAAGTDADCESYAGLRDAYVTGLVSRTQLETAARRVLEHKLRLGVLDPSSRVPYSNISSAAIGSPAHRLKAVQAAQRGIVLLKNEASGGGGKLLPLNPLLLRKVVLVGPHANSSEHLLGNYYDAVSGPVTTPLQAFQAALGPERVVYAGSDFQPQTGADGVIDASTRAALDADACILFLGTSAINPHSVAADGYSMQALLTEGEGFDRRSLLLPGTQETLALQLARMTAAPLIVVLLHGGPLDVSALQESERIGAMLTAWFPGQGAQAIADVVLGAVSPSGRLPVTFYKESYTRQARMSDFDMRAWPGRTHRFLQVPALYPFGHGLSYARFSYSRLASVTTAADAAGGPVVSAAVSVRNEGGMEAEEVVLAFLHCRPHAASRLRFWRRPGVAHRALGDFRRVRLRPGQAATVELTIGGDNLGNMLSSGRSDGALRGRLSLEAGGLSVPLPRLACLLTEPGAGAKAS